MEYLYLVLELCGGLGAFLIGMNMMSDSMSRLAHGRLKSMLNKTANNRIAGVGIGAAVTMIIQSSSATTVMVVGLVNAGIMTLFQATAVIMGANIGTTITAWIASLGSLDVSAFLLVLAVVGVFMTMFSKTEKVKVIGTVLAGLGLIFVGLGVMSDSMDNEDIIAVIKDALSVVKNPFLLLLIGIVATGVIQSSSAVTSIVVVLATSGVLIGGTGDGVYYVIIGSNIGTCVTAMISSIGANPNARRAAVIHLLFNCLGAILFAVFLLCWQPFGTSFSETVLEKIFPSTATGDNYQFQIAFFHTLFNVTCTCIFLPFAKGFVKLANLLVREKKSSDEGEPKGLLGDLDERLMRQPSVALAHLYQEAGKMLTYSVSTLTEAFEAFVKKDTSVKQDIQDRNNKLSGANRAAVEYLVKLSASSLVMEDEKTISNMHYVLNDIVRIGELADNVTKYTDHYENDGLIFSAEFISMSQEMFEKIKKLYAACLAAFSERDFSKLQEVDAIEDEIDNYRRKLVNQHIKRLNEGKCQPQSASVFINLVGNLERAADHLTYIAHSIE